MLSRQGGISRLSGAQPDIGIESRWRPAHKGGAGNGKADKWAKLAAEEPDAHGVVWPVRNKTVAAPEIPSTPQAGNLGEELG
jgi:ribonuclease HI